MGKGQWAAVLDTQAAQAAARNGLDRLAALVETPFGPMVLVQRGDSLSELRFEGVPQNGEIPANTPLLTEAAAQLAAYFRGERRAFALPLAPLGTPFQTRIWQALWQTVLYGQTVSYGELARRANQPAAARAVGMANHANPLPIFIPCHRVIGASGKLVGYGGGLALKQSLLALEAAHG